MEQQAAGGRQRRMGGYHQLSRARHRGVERAMRPSLPTPVIPTEGASFALGHPEKFIDYSYRSEHEMTVAAKAIIDRYYGPGRGSPTSTAVPRAAARRWSKRRDIRTTSMASSRAPPRTPRRTWMRGGSGWRRRCTRARTASSLPRSRRSFTRPCSRSATRSTARRTGCSRIRPPASSMRARWSARRAMGRVASRQRR